MSKELEKKGQSQLVVPDVFRRADDATPTTIDPKDITIPRLVVMQGMSKFVAQETAQPGDIANSVTGEVLAGKGKTIKFVPLSHFKTIIRSKNVGKGLPQFVSQEAWNPKTHANLEWEETIDGVEYYNTSCLNFYVLLERDLDNPAAFPYLLTFRRSSYRNGKKLVNHFMQMDMMKAEPWFGTLELLASKEQNDEGTFYVFDIKVSSQTDPKYAPKIRMWADTLRKNAHKVDDSIEDEVVATRPKGKKGEVSAGAQF